MRRGTPPVQPSRIEHALEVELANTLLDLNGEFNRVLNASSWDEAKSRIVHFLAPAVKDALIATHRATKVEREAGNGEYVCKCGVRVMPHRCVVDATF